MSHCSQGERIVGDRNFCDSQSAGAEINVPGMITMYDTYIISN